MKCTSRTRWIAAQLAAAASVPVLLASCAGSPPPVREKVNPDTGLSSWKAEHPGFSIELIQVVPDYVRAVYASRGLPADQADKVASFCVFGTILHNTSDAPLSWSLADWGYRTTDGNRHRLKLKSEWVAEWEQAGVAFKWTLLPDEQTYAVGDWGQGFTTYDLKPGEVFDLEYAWSQHGETRTGIIRRARCAPDI